MMPTPGFNNQQMQDVVGSAGLDHQFVLLRNNMSEKIIEYIGRKQSTADWRRRLPELARRLEEILFRKYTNKNDYYNMMKGPVEPQLQFAIKTLRAHNQQNQQNQQMSRQIASSSGYGTMIPTSGITQGTSGNSRMPYITDNTSLSSSGAGMVPQNASIDTLLPVDMAAGSGRFYGTGPSALITSNNQNMCAANLQSRSRMNPMLLTNQLHMQHNQPQLQIKTEVLDQSEKVNFQSSQLTHEQLLRQQHSVQQHQVQPNSQFLQNLYHLNLQHQVQPNSQFLQNQYHLNQPQPNSQHQQAMLRSNSFKQSQLSSGHSMQLSEQGALPHTELISSQASETAELPNFQGQYQQRSAHDVVKGEQMFSGSQNFHASAYDSQQLLPPNQQLDDSS